MSALNWMVRGALPSSVSESAHASSGAAEASSSSRFAAGAVVGGAAGAGGVGAAVVAVGLGVSVVVGAPPPQPARARVTSMPSEAEQPSIRIVVPPGPDVGKRARIFTDALRTVNVGRGFSVGATAFAVLLLSCVAPAAHGVPTRGDLPVLVVLAAFPDHPLAHDRAYFAGLIERLVAYYDEVSTGRLRIVLHIGGPVVTLPSPRARYVGKPVSLARDAALAVAAAAPA